MPHIEPQRRFDIDVLGEPPEKSGELCYAISDLFVQYVETHGASWKTFNDILGAATGSILEFYRGPVAHYENDKRNQHGDVFEKVYDLIQAKARSDAAAVQQAASPRGTTVQASKA